MEAKNIGVYGIFDAENGECLYVGQSVKIPVRWKKHIRELKNGTHLRKDFVEWFRAHDCREDAMDFQILENCPREKQTLNKLEVKWFLNKRPRFFGVEPSPNGGWCQSREIMEALEGLTKPILEEMYIEKRMGLVAISKEIGVSHVSIFHKMEEFGIPRRSKGNRPSKGRKTFPKVCVICGEDFVAKRVSIITCGRSCGGKLASQNCGSKRVPNPGMRGNKNAVGNRGGKISSHNRWHVKRNLFSEDCELCAASVAK